MFFLKELPTREILESYARRYPEMEAETVGRALSMLRSASVLLRRLEAYFGEHGLSLTRFLILVVIEREEALTPEEAARGLTATELGARIDVSKPVLSTTLKALTKEDLLHAEEDETDRRSRRYLLTRAGREQLAALLPGYYRLIQAHMAQNHPGAEEEPCA